MVSEYFPFSIPFQQGAIGICYFFFQKKNLPFAFPYPRFRYYVVGCRQVGPVHFHAFSEVIWLLVLVG